MCHAITKSGKRCKVKGGNYFCHIHEPYVEPTIEEQRETMLQKILNNPLQPQVEAWTLFQDIDFTSETLDIIKRAKYVCNWTDEKYNRLVATYLDDNGNSYEIYDLIKDTIYMSLDLGNTKDILLKLQKIELMKVVIILFFKIALSRGRYWSPMERMRRIYNYEFPPIRDLLVNLYHEKQLNKLRVNALKKYTPICDDVCNYIIADYL